MLRVRPTRRLLPLRVGRYRRYFRYALLVNIADMRHMQDMAPEPTYPVKKLVNLTEEQAQRISSYRFENRIASENEAIRRLIELGLDGATRAPAKNPEFQTEIRYQPRSGREEG